MLYLYKFMKLSMLLTVFYAWIPTLIVRLLRVGVADKDMVQPSLALTFDDGPDPEYTPLVLDLLQKYGVKATFFVLGEHAAEHPALIRRMKEDGHMIGIHNYVHRSNAILTPWGVRRQVRETARIVEEITGEQPHYYRPPWGVVNVFDIIRVRFPYKLVLWSVMVGDWKSKGGADRIRSRLLSKVRNGAVIVLHDSGHTFGADEDAPGYMLDALQDFIILARRKGYRFLRMDEYSKERRQPVYDSSGLHIKA